MAVPTYGTDIVTLDGSVYTATGGTSLVAGDYAATGGGATAINEETDYYLIGTECISKTAFGNGAQEKGIVDDTNSGGNIATTLASGNNPGGNQYVYIWCFFNAPASLATFSLPGNLAAGLHAIIGPSTSAYNRYSISGSNLQDYGAEWVCGSIDVNVTPSNQFTLTTVGGGAGGNYTVFGAGASIPTQGPTKGAPFAIEGIRRGAYVDAVQGEVANPTTFAGIESFDGGNSATGRLGVFTLRQGVYILNTEVRLGSAAALCFMRDTAGTTIKRQNDATPSYDNTEADGGKHIIRILNSSSDIEWENVTILEDSIDILITPADNPTVKFTACSFFGVRLLQCGGINTQLIRCTLPSSEAQISSNTMSGTNTEARTIQNGATITSCTVEGTSLAADTSGIEVSGTAGADMNKITNCNFTGNGRALIIPGTITTTETVVYSGHSYEAGYTTGATTTGITGTSGTSNAVIECTVNSPGVLTVSVSNTSQIPSVYNKGTGTIIIEAAVEVTISGLLGNTEVSVLENPSPYSSSVAAPVTLFDIDFVSAVTGTDIQLVTTATNVTSIGSSSTDFTSMVDGLVAGNKVRVTNRADLSKFDTFDVVSVSTNSIVVTPVASSVVTLQELLDSPGETVTVEKVNASYDFATSSGTVVDILAFRVGSLPVYILENTLDTTKDIPISQTLDRVVEV